MEELPILILLLILSGFFSGAEIALFSLGPAKIQALKNKAKTKREKKRVARLELVKSDVDKLLVTILIGNNVVNVAASSSVTPPLVSPEIMAISEALAEERRIAEANKPKATYYYVRKGESLPIIARKTGVSVSQLKKWNGISGSLIYPKQKLKLYKS